MQLGIDGKAPMSNTRVGALDNPAHYGARSVAVYANSAGFYIKVNGSRNNLQRRAALHLSTAAREGTAAGLSESGRGQVREGCVRAHVQLH